MRPSFYDFPKQSALAYLFNSMPAKMFKQTNESTIRIKEMLRKSIVDQPTLRLCSQKSLESRNPSKQGRLN
jgi:hypothetical protein